MFNEVLYLTTTKEVDYKIFSKVADLTVERVKLTIAESPKSCETKNYEPILGKEKKETHFKTWLCVKDSVRGKKTFNRRSNNGG